MEIIHIRLLEGLNPDVDDMNADRAARERAWAQRHPHHPRAKNLLHTSGKPAPKQRVWKRIGEVRTRLLDFLGLTEADFNPNTFRHGLGATIRNDFGGRQASAYHKRQREAGKSMGSRERAAERRASTSGHAQHLSHEAAEASKHTEGTSEASVHVAAARAHKAAADAHRTASEEGSRNLREKHLAAVKSHEAAATHHWSKG